MEANCFKCWFYNAVNDECEADENELFDGCPIKKRLKELAELPCDTL